MGLRLQGGLSSLPDMMDTRVEEGIVVGTEMPLSSYLAVTQGRGSRLDPVSTAWMEAQHFSPGPWELLDPRCSQVAACLLSSQRQRRTRAMQTSSFISQ